MEESKAADVVEFHKDSLTGYSGVRLRDQNDDKKTCCKHAFVSITKFH